MEGNRIPSVFTYTCMAALRNCLNDDLYKQFLLLSVAITLLVRNMQEVGDNWSLYSMKVIGYFAYEEACCKLKKAEETSGLESDFDVEKSRNKRKKQLSSGKEVEPSSSDSPLIQELPELPEPPFILQNNIAYASTSQYPVTPMSYGMSRVHASVESPTLLMDRSAAVSASFLRGTGLRSRDELIVEKLATLEAQNRQMIRMRQLIIGNMEAAASIGVPLPDGISLPLRNVQDVFSLILTLTLSRRGEKTGIRDLFIMKLIYATAAEVEGITNQWLKYASDRKGERNNRRGTQSAATLSHAAATTSSKRPRLMSSSSSDEA